MAELGELEAPNQALLRLRKKGSGVQFWLLIDGQGSSKVLQAGKYAIMRRAGLPARDLRILDPLLSHSSTILGRDRAIVVHLEHIRAIITAEEVMLLRTQEVQAAAFASELQRRLENSGRNATDRQFLALDSGDPMHNHTDDKNDRGMLSILAPSLRSSASDLQGNDAYSEASVSQTTNYASSPLHIGASVQLPFEFQALEVCLEAACRYLDAEAAQLTATAYPALDELTTNFSTLNLQRVRQIKSRLVEISGRVQKVRDEIEQLLDDDGDMAEMYLSEKLMRQELVVPSSPTLSDADAGVPFTTHGGGDAQVVSKGLLAVVDGDSGSTEHDERFGVDSAELGTPHAKCSDNRLVAFCSSDSQSLDRRHSPPGLGVTVSSFQVLKHSGHDSSSNRTSRSSRDGRSNGSSTSSSKSRSRIGKKLDVEDLEMLLEAYFVQIDSTLNKLSALRDYVDDTEDYINIMLDDKQNNLLQTGVMLTAATLILGAFVVVTGVFGMNIGIGIFDPEGPESYFYWVVGGCSFGSIVLYMLVVAFLRWKGVLE